MPVVPIPNRSLIRLSGQECAHFLHNLVTPDIEELAHGELVPGALLTPQGKILFDFLVSRDGDAFLFECQSDLAADIAKRLKFYRLRAKVDIELQEQALVTASFDNDSSALPLQDQRFSGSQRVARAYGPALGAIASLDAYDLLRIENGVTEGGSDYAFGDMFPHDVNLDQIMGVSFSKGCYVGQEVVSRMQHRGTARRRVLIAEGTSPLTSKAEITVSGRAVGALGTALGNEALAIARIDKIKDANDAGEAILADGIPVSLSLPPHVSYGWPQMPDTGE